MVHLLVQYFAVRKKALFSLLDGPVGVKMPSTQIKIKLEVVFSVRRLQSLPQAMPSGQSYNHFTIVNHNPRVVMWAIFQSEQLQSKVPYKIDHQLDLKVDAVLGRPQAGKNTKTKYFFCCSRLNGLFGSRRASVRIQSLIH